MPVLLNETHSFKNNSSKDLEFMIIGFASQKGVLETLPAGGGRRGAQSLTRAAGDRLKANVGC